MSARRWPLALGVSLGLHAGLGTALWTALRRPSSTPPPAVSDRKPASMEVLRIGSVMSRRAAPAAPGAPGARALEPRRVARRVEDTPTRGGVEAPLDASPDGDELLAPQFLGELGGVGPPAESGCSAGACGDAAVAPSGEAVGSGDGAASAEPSAVTLEVHGCLARAAHDCYPAAARRFHQQGRVEVSFCVDARGAAERVSIAPSGLSLLDDAAQSCVLARAAPFPVAAQGRCFRVPVDFGQ